MPPTEENEAQWIVHQNESESVSETEMAGATPGLYESPSGALLAPGRKTDWKVERTRTHEARQEKHDGDQTKNQGRGAANGASGVEHADDEGSDRAKNAVEGTHVLRHNTEEMEEKKREVQGRGNPPESEQSLTIGKPNPLRSSRALDFS
jgi:hypothetical protein